MIVNRDMDDFFIRLAIVLSIAVSLNFLINRLTVKGGWHRCVVGIVCLAVFYVLIFVKPDLGNFEIIRTAVGWGIFGGFISCVNNWRRD